MVKVLCSLFVISAIILNSHSVTAKPEADEEKEGIYRSRGLSRITYWVDTITQLCFATYLVKRGDTGAGVGLLKIDCKNLAKRPEWKPIITWVE